MTEIKMVSQAAKREDLLDLFSASFGHTSSPKLWDWKHVRNPLAKSDPEIVVAVDNGRIVGARPLMLGEMWLKSHKVTVAQPCDTMVHPQYRKRGIFAAMNHLAIDHLRKNGYALLYNFPGPMSRPGYLRQGWQTVSDIELLVCPVNSRRLALSTLKNRYLAHAVGFIYDRFLARSAPGYLPADDLDVRVSDRFTDELKAADTLRDIEAIEIVREEEYLRWRYDGHPENSYKYIVAMRGNELCGCAVISVQEQRLGLVCGIIADYVVRHADTASFHAVITRCLTELEKSDCDLVLTWSFCHPQFRRHLMTHFGFKSSLSFPYRRIMNNGCFVVREVDSRVLEKIDIYTKTNWRVTHAYHDST